MRHDFSIDLSPKMIGKVPLSFPWWLSPTICHFTFAYQDRRDGGVRTPSAHGRKRIGGLSGRVLYACQMRANMVWCRVSGVTAATDTFGDPFNDCHPSWFIYSYGPFVWNYLKAFRNQNDLQPHHKLSCFTTNDDKAGLFRLSASDSFTIVGDQWDSDPGIVRII